MSEVVAHFNRYHPEGTAVTAWPGTRPGRVIEGETRSRAWLIGGTPCVMVTGYAGGIALDHVDPWVQRDVCCEEQLLCTICDGRICPVHLPDVEVVTSCDAGPHHEDCVERCRECSLQGLADYQEHQRKDY